MAKKQQAKVKTVTCGHAVANELVYKHSFRFYRVPWNATGYERVACHAIAGLKHRSGKLMSNGAGSIYAYDWAVLASKEKGTWTLYQGVAEYSNTSRVMYSAVRRMLDKHGVRYTEADAFAEAKEIQTRSTQRKAEAKTARKALPQGTKIVSVK